jgi:hypothetical protein
MTTECTPHIAKRKTGSSCTLRCDGTKICIVEIVEKRFRNTHAEMAMRTTAGCKNKEH